VSTAPEAAEPQPQTAVYWPGSDHRQTPGAGLGAPLRTLDARNEPQPPPSETVADPAPSQEEVSNPEAVLPEHDKKLGTAQKLALEANATAEALDNLKRLLAHRLPDLTMDPAPESHQADAVRPPPIQASDALRHELETPPEPEPATNAPIELPALAVPEERPRRRLDIELRGFLAGFALSWAFGAVLYAYLVFG
jgi:hypothetical protein